MWCINTGDATREEPEERISLNLHCECKAPGAVMPQHGVEACPCDALGISERAFTITLSITFTFHCNCFLILSPVIKVCIFLVPSSKIFVIIFFLWRNLRKLIIKMKLLFINIFNLLWINFWIFLKRILFSLLEIGTCNLVM